MDKQKLATEDQATDLTIQLRHGLRIPILYYDKHIIAIDKPYGWILAPVSWVETSRNLQLAIEEAIQQRAPWVRRLQIKYLRFIHRLDAECTGVLLLARSRLAVRFFTKLFQSRNVRKLYLAVVEGAPRTANWVADYPLKVLTKQHPIRVVVDPKEGKPAKTLFWALGKPFRYGNALFQIVAAEPLTGRTHQIRLHASAAGVPIVGDPLYGKVGRNPNHRLALRAVAYAYRDPFDHQPRDIRAPYETFLSQYGPPPEIISTVGSFVDQWPYPLST